MAYTHGLSMTREYRCWYGMKRRCLEINNPVYHNYGGRGVKICDRWLNSFENFLSDMGNAPSLKHSLDRYPNVNGDYEPSNCRWATSVEQNNNKQKTVKITYKGRTQSMKDWCRELNLPYGRIRTRYELNWTPEEMFELPKCKSKWDTLK